MFGLIGHFGLSNDVNISLFLSPPDIRISISSTLRFSTLDRIFELRDITEEMRAHQQMDLQLLLDFHKTVKPFSLEVPREYQREIMALYQKIVSREHTSARLSEPIQSITRVKQKCPLSTTLFGFYMDKVFEHGQFVGT